MTVEQKAKAYDEALKRAREWSETKNGYYMPKELCEEIFPELNESKDEKIRKELIQLISCMHDADHRKKDWLAWLEKQGKSDKIVEKAKIEKQRVLVTESDGSANIDWDTRSLEDARKLLEYGLQYINTELEKQGEQKLADKVEPKFHEGDWVVQGYNILKIKCVGDTHYCFETVGGYVDDMLISEIDSQFHLWTIQDAKDGDVLDANGAPFIYKKHDKNYVYYYCGVNLGGEFTVAHGIDAWNSKYKVYPATKEQRDTLFVKMKEAGYEWDAEKKE